MARNSQHLAHKCFGLRRIDTLLRCHVFSPFPVQQITAKGTCHAQQIECFGKAMLIMLLLKKCERLLVVA